MLLCIILIPVRVAFIYMSRDVTIDDERLLNLGLFWALFMLLSRKGSLSCQICYVAVPQFNRSHPKDSPVSSPLTSQECWGNMLTWITSGFRLLRQNGISVVGKLAILENQLLSLGKSIRKTKPVLKGMFIKMVRQQSKRTHGSEAQ